MTKHKWPVDLGSNPEYFKKNRTKNAFCPIEQTLQIAITA